ncbi:hypothetical protein GGI12_002062 [Dipsacomyces acuminosporus]|nr:hypothetical protein GGI12_002062 [Dipsacomyces acuminosporus]
MHIVDDKSDLANPRLLPDILYLVTKQYYNEYAKSRYNMPAKRLENLQPLAATCASWRQITLPLLYGSVVGATERVRELVILSNSVVIDPKELLTMLKKHRFDQCSWPNIKSLHFYQGDRFYSIPNMAIYDPSSITQLNVYLSTYLPNLSKVNYRSLIDQRLYRENPFNMLINSRLQALSEMVIGSHYYPVLTSQTLPSSLKTLSIKCFSQGAVQLPMLLTESLVELCLTDVTPAQVRDILFIHLRSSSTAGHQRFPNLRILDLDFAPQPSRMAQNDGDNGIASSGWANGRRARSKTFANLQKLFIRRYPSNINDLLTLLPCHLITHLGMDGSGGQGILSLDLDPFTNLHTSQITCAGIIRMGHEQAENFTHRLLSTRSNIQRLRFTVVTHQILTLPKTIGCSNLRILELRIPLSIDSLIGILPQLPYLWKAALPYITTEPSMVDPVDNIDNLRTRFVVKNRRPLSFSLQKIVMDFCDYRQCTKALCFNILAFLVNIPSLLILVHEADFANALKDTIAYLPNYKVKVPSHIRSLVIENHVSMPS